MPTFNDPNGQPATVQLFGGKGRLNMDSRSATRAYYLSRDDAQAYSWVNATYDYAAGDTILLVKNTNTTKVLVVEAVLVSGDTATEVIVHRPTTAVATPTGTAVTGVNLNGQSSLPASAVAKGDETTNSQGDIIVSARIPVNTPINLGVPGVVRLAQDQSIGVDFVTDGAACNVTITGYYE